MMNKDKLKPFVKWVGGKRQILNILSLFLPSKIKTYYEPFLGGGAFFLELEPKKAVISDVNNELITTWNVIKNNHSLLINTLNNYSINHNEKAEIFYYDVRSQNPDHLSDVDKAARFLYLNKTCFNGIYRVNSKNKFNTPFNKKTFIDSNSLFNVNNICNINKYLNTNNIKILNNDFESVIKNAKQGDFIFLDPPYDYDDKGFDLYTASGFGKKGQERLCQILIELDNKGVKWLLTNHNTTFINDLYKNYYIYRVPTNRFVNSNSLNRKNAAIETIVTNCKLAKESKIIFNENIAKRVIGKTNFIQKGL